MRMRMGDRDEGCRSESRPTMRDCRRERKLRAGGPRREERIEEDRGQRTEDRGSRGPEVRDENRE
jgi:hypothetical protein